MHTYIYARILKLVLSYILYNYANEYKLKMHKRIYLNYTCTNEFKLIQKQTIQLLFICFKVQPSSISAAIYRTAYSCMRT